MGYGFCQYALRVDIYYIQEARILKILYLHLRFLVYTPKFSSLYLMILCIKFGGYWPT